MAWVLVAAAATKAVGSIIQGESNAQAQEYNAGVARQNAVIATQQGEAASQAQARDSARKIGAMTASYGASGVQTDSGSPLDVLADSARMSALDNLTIKYNYALRAKGYTEQGLLADRAAESSRTSGVLGALGSAGEAYAMNQMKIPNYGGVKYPSGMTRYDD